MAVRRLGSDPKTRVKMHFVDFLRPLNQKYEGKLKIFFGKLNFEFLSEKVLFSRFSTAGLICCYGTESFYSIWLCIQR